MALVAAGGETLVEPSIWLLLWPVALLGLLVLLVLAVVLIVRATIRRRRAPERKGP